MSSKEERKAQAREEKAIDRAIEETKDNAEKVIREVKRDLPESTATFHEYQEKNLRAVRDMTTEFLDSQKEVAKSLQAAYRPMAWPFGFFNPQVWAENYVRGATNIADILVGAVRLQNDLTVEAMESTRLFTETAAKNSRELGRLSVENARFAEQVSRNIYEQTTR